VKNGHAEEAAQTKTDPLRPKLPGFEMTPDH
jgi:hypothetical protein